MARGGGGAGADAAHRSAVRDLRGGLVPALRPRLVRERRRGDRRRRSDGALLPAPGDRRRAAEAVGFSPVGRVRLKDVAARAKVDTSTASRVLSGQAGMVRDETAKRVLAASRELGYTPNAFARALRTRRTGSIGVVLPEFSNPVYAAVID